MAKYFGTIGFAEPKHDNLGVWVDANVVEKEYYGDVERNTRRLQNTQDLNDDISISNIISIIGDPYINDNYFNIRYATFMGQKWKVINVDVQFPRLKLTLGGLYN